MRIPPKYQALLAAFAKAEEAKQLLQSHNSIATALDVAREVLEDEALKDFHANARAILFKWIWRVEDSIRVHIQQRKDTYEVIRILTSTLYLFNDPIFGIDPNHFGDGTAGEFLALRKKGYDNLDTFERDFIDKKVSEWRRKGKRDPT